MSRQFTCCSEGKGRRPTRLQTLLSAPPAMETVWSPPTAPPPAPGLAGCPAGPTTLGSATPPGRLCAHITPHTLVHTHLCPHTQSHAADTSSHTLTHTLVFTRIHTHKCIHTLTHTLSHTRTYLHRHTHPLTHTLTLIPAPGIFSGWAACSLLKF